MSHSDDALYMPTYVVPKSVAHLLDSDSGEEGDAHNVTPIKRRRVDHKQPQQSSKAATSRVARRLVPDVVDVDATAAAASSDIIVLSSEEDDDGDLEVLRQVANDPEAIRFRELAMRSAAAAAAAVISIDSDDDEKQPQPGVPRPPKATSFLTLAVLWTSRTGSAESDMYTLAPMDVFQVLLDAFCAKLNVPTHLVRMSFDGSPVLPYETPEDKEVADGDQVDMVVDWDQVKAPRAAANAVRVRVQRVGSKKTQVFTIAPEMTVKKLLESFCSLHNLVPATVVLKLFGEVLQEDVTIESCLLDADDILVAESSAEAVEMAPDESNTVTITLRFADNDVENHRIDLASKVETLVAKVSRKRHVEASQVKFVIDGDAMHPHQPFHSYDLEGDEIIDVKLATV
ncbi:hypothetical protein H257_07354 [Aphanomyces astaci]|uniref:Ubiquitin-like domain-containing protein n=1 Tax=Aphanomyces astaci TaxID=112090 RepID=W4GK52_APHAT|nr:hypothetical protein H257_07354 [Aphanomyces astaci]ETV79303.1 hypothetical protein H257_07354 [Aphanomyces astaci]|eukprot:XP_009831144.1 hypothetical protein H257_07354 [Aphanomyces astaci]